MCKKKRSIELGLLKHAKRYAQEDMLDNMCQSILVFYNHTSVIVALSGDSGATMLETLLKVKNFAARIFTNIPFDTPAAALLQRLGWPTVDRLINLKLCTMVYESLIDCTCKRAIFSKNCVIFIPGCYAIQNVICNSFWLLTIFFSRGTRLE